MTGTHFLFAYGSLIDPDSRDLRAESGVSIPGQLRGYRQGWIQPYSRTTFSGVTRDASATSVGIFLEITEDALRTKLDEREQAGEGIEDPVYRRVLVDPKEIDLFGGSSELHGTVWVYESINPGSASEEFPVWQSYVDVVLRSCLSIGQEFAKRFVLSQESWAVPWINDRRRPRYRRVGRRTWLRDKERIDALLCDCGVLQYRRPEICDTILDAIGNTPMVRINRITRGIVEATVMAKVETFNPGNSIKDRMAVKMIEDEERKKEEERRLKPGGTIIEGTSGNTGMGLAMAAVVKGYKCIFTTTDKQSQEKADALRALGAQVEVCPTDVDPEHPSSYYSVSSRLERDVLNSWKPDQYNNPSNRRAHYEQTGPEIWEQTDGKITHLVVGVGTGGTISGVGKFLKEQNPAIRVWGIDTYGSVFKKYKETGLFDKNEIYPYSTEGIGEDVLPENVDFEVIDHFEKVTDRDAALMTRRIAREEGIFAGNSAGAAMAGLLQLKDHFRKEDVVVVIFHDHGTRYLAKIFNDDWMKKKGYLDRPGLTARDLVASRVSGELLAVEESETIEGALEIMSQRDFSQISISRGGRVVGSLNESHLYAELLRDPGIRRQRVGSIAQAAFPFADISTPVELLAGMITAENPAVLVRDFRVNKTFIVTRSDVLRVI